MKKVTTIRAGQFRWPLSPESLWNHRGILYRLFLREFQVRYRQTVLGIMWAWLQPALAMLIFTFIFGRVARLSTGDLPYSVFALTGLVVWFYFSNSFAHGSISLVENRTLIIHNPFPLEFIPFTVVATKLVDLAISFVLLFAWMFFVYPIAPTWAWLFLPLHFFFVFLLVTGVTIFLSALCVRYRDVRYAVPFLTQVWLFSTPIIYPMSIAAPEKRWIFLLNPLSVWIEGLRDILFSTNNVSIEMYLVSAIFVLMVYVLGLLYFRKVERAIPDIV